MLSSIRHGWKSWKNAKGVAVLAVCALALGIGSAAAIYSVVQAVLLNPLGFAQQDRFVAVWSAFSERPGWHSALSFPTMLDFRARNRTLEVFGCMASSSYNITHGGQVSRVVGLEVSPSLVQSLGVKPELGRWFDTPGEPSAVISKRLWQRLGGDPHLVGRSLVMDGKPYTVLGVMPEWFHLPIDEAFTDVWVPLYPVGDQGTRRISNYLVCTGKMKAGVSLASTSEDLLRVTQELHHEYPNEFISDRVLVRRLVDEASTDIRPTLGLLFAASIALLLIACANVAGLLLARTVARARDTALRVALGATTWQLGVQYFSEGLVVAAAGALLGTLLSFALVRVVIAIASAEIPRGEDIAVDARVLAFALALAVLCAILFSLAPLYQARRTSAREALSDGARASASARSRGLLRVFVVCEIALAFGLMAVSALSIRQLNGLRNEYPGFNPDHLVTLHMYAPDAKHPTDPEMSAFQTRLIDAIESIPGVDRAGFTTLLPLKGWGINTYMDVEGRPVPPLDKEESIEFRVISPGYFGAMEIPVMEGRGFNSRDVRKHPPEAMSLVINQTLAKLFWPKGGAVGAYVNFPTFEGSRFRVVGVVGDSRNTGLGKPVRPEVYFSYLQRPNNRLAWAIRSNLPPGELGNAISAAVRRVDPDQPIFNVQSMREVILESIAKERLQSVLVTLFGAAALILSMLGVYGVASYAVRQRTTEIGTRMAIGASTADLMRLVMGDAMKMAGIGLGVGLALALLATSPIASGNMPHMHGTDVRSFLLAAAMVAACTGLACFIPGWRATLVSPMVAIRNEPGVLWQRTRYGILRVKEHLAGVVSRSDEQAAASESDLMAEIADVSRGASSFSEATQCAIECLRSRIQAESITLFVQRGADQPYRRQASTIPAIQGDGELPADALIVGRLRGYPGVLPYGAGELEATERWAQENAAERLPELAELRAVSPYAVARVAVKKEISGILFVGCPVGRQNYNAIEKRLVRGVCAQLAMMIENSRLTDRIVEQDRLRRELTVAGEVQQRLFPAHPMETAHIQLAGVCVPARGVGGDYYDFLDLGNKTIGIALADVAGKGIAAALIMSVVQASLRSLAGSGSVTPAELATKMNALLHRSTGANGYATFFYGEVDEERGELRYVNAGHNPPYLLRANGRSRNGHADSAHFDAARHEEVRLIEELSTGGTIIGMFPKTDYEVGVTRLRPGDLMIAFTDGVPEALNPRDEEYGEDRVQSILRAAADLPIREMAAHILQELKKWISDAAQYDDLTFILMKVN